MPSPADVLGYGAGERFTNAGGVFRYASRLATASPRVALIRYGETPEGRPLILLAISREDRADRLEEIRASIGELARPELPAARAAEMAREVPAVIWLGYGVHGDEASSTEAALWTAYDLAVGADETAGILDSLVVLIDPMQNPDGRDRYVGWYGGAHARPPNPSADAFEHHPPWPRGRFNHYLFDLNRDWSWGVQPETRARLLEYNRWNPQVLIDFHEMSYTSTYFFFPAAEPVNPVFPLSLAEWGEYFGRANAREFDRRRWLYYTKETFDLFYPGYADSWSSLTGAIGMTFEQAGGGRAGLSIRRPDGSTLSLADRVAHHRAAGLTTLRAAARRKTELLEDFAAFHRDVGEGPDILLVPGRNPEAAQALVGLLGEQGVVVERSVRSFRAVASPHFGFPEREEFPKGTYRVPRSQRRSRLARALLESETPLEDPGVEYTYDITAWSLPYAYGVEAHAAGGVRDNDFEAVTATPPEQPGPAPRPAPGLLPAPRPTAPGPWPAVYGYLVPPTVAAAGPLFRYAAMGGRAHALAEAFAMEGRSWPPGTVFLPADDSTDARVRRAGLAPFVNPVESGLSTSGVDLGSARSLALEAPRIAVLTGEGVRPTSYGQVWYMLERGVGIPFDPLRIGQLSAGTLARYDVVVAPAGSADAYEAEHDVLAGWVEAGGTLVAMGSAARWAAGAIAAVPVREADSTDIPDEERLRRGLRTRAERRSERWDESVTGVVLPLRVDLEHPLAWGATGGNDEGAFFALHYTDLSFEPAEEFESVVHFPLDVSEVSGVISRGKLDQVAGSSWLVVGSLGEGRVILFADDPLFRLFWRSAFVLFTNALLYGHILD